MKDYIESLKKRAAIKQFNPNKKISNEKIKKILDSAILSPSSYGLQAWKITVVEKESLKKELAKEAIPQTQASSCSHLLFFSYKTEIDIDYIREFIIASAKVKNTPLDNIEKSANNMQSYIFGINNSKKDYEIKCWLSRQIYIALGIIILSASLEDIDSSPMEGLNQENVDSILGLNKEGYRTVVACALGYRLDEDIVGKSPKFRRSFDEVVNII